MTTTVAERMAGTAHNGGASADDARRRAERRAFIRAAHPDAGGDPQAFIRGLAGFDSSPPAPVAAPASTASEHPARPQVRRSQRPDRVVLRTLRDLRRRASGQPPRRLQ